MSTKDTTSLGVKCSLVVNLGISGDFVVEFCHGMYHSNHNEYNYKLSMLHDVGDFECVCM